MAGRIILVIVWLVGIGAWTSVYLSRYGEEIYNPPTVFLEGKPVSFLITGMMPAVDAPHKAPTRAEVLERVKATSPGNPVGRGDNRRLNPFRYIYREILPGTVTAEADVVAIAAEIAASVQRDGALHGRPFVFIPTSETGWLFNESFRVCLPVSDSVKTPPNMKEARFDGAMVAFRKDGQLGEQGKIEEMERWAEAAQRAATGSVPDSSGPFLMRLVEPDSATSGQVAWEWMVPIGPLPAADPVRNAAPSDVGDQAPAPSAIPAGASGGTD